jgi:hypothetical protein
MEHTQRAPCCPSRIFAALRALRVNHRALHQHPARRTYTTTQHLQRKTRNAKPATQNPQSKTRKAKPETQKYPPSVT